MGSDNYNNSNVSDNENSRNNEENDIVVIFNDKNFTIMETTPFFACKPESENIRPLPPSLPSSQDKDNTKRHSLLSIKKLRNVMFSLTVPPSSFFTHIFQFSLYLPLILLRYSISWTVSITDKCPRLSFFFIKSQTCRTYPR